MNGWLFAGVGPSFVGEWAARPVRTARAPARARTDCPLVPAAVDAPLPVVMPALARFAAAPAGPRRSPQRSGHSLRPFPHSEDVDVMLAWSGRHHARSRGPAGGTARASLPEDPPAPVVPLPQAHATCAPHRRPCPGRGHDGEADEFRLHVAWADGQFYAGRPAGRKGTVRASASRAWPVAGDLASELFAACAGGIVKTQGARRGGLACRADSQPGEVQSPPGWDAPCAFQARPPGPAPRAEGEAPLAEGVEGVWWQAAIAGQAVSPAVHARPGAASIDALLAAHFGAIDTTNDQLRGWMGGSAVTPRPAPKRGAAAGELAPVEHLASPWPPLLSQGAAASRARQSPGAPREEHSRPDATACGLVVIAGLGYCTAGSVYVAGACAGDVVGE